MSMREATASEVKAHKERVIEKRHVSITKADTRTANMAMLTRISKEQATIYGAKAANLGEIAKAQISKVHVPKGFGLPFFYYTNHLKQHGLDERLVKLLEDPRFEANASWRKSALKEFRQALVDAPIAKDVLTVVYKRVRLSLGGRGVFVRSSTNAEDLPGFNGAGLYDTVANVHSKEDLGSAIKKVWASLWNFRAVEERSLFGINHSEVYAGVLIQRGINATAAGVLVTSNLFDREETDAYTINAKWGLGIRVVEGQRVPEQIIFDTSNNGTKIISRSDDPVMLVFDEAGGIREIPTKGSSIILTEERAKRLSDAVTAFLPLFSSTQPLDIEWLFEGEKVWIVQARPYIFATKR